MNQCRRKEGREHSVCTHCHESFICNDSTKKKYAWTPNKDSPLYKCLRCKRHKCLDCIVDFGQTVLQIMPDSCCPIYHKDVNHEDKTMSQCYSCTIPTFNFRGDIPPSIEVNPDIDINDFQDYNVLPQALGKLYDEHGSSEAIRRTHPDPSKLEDDACDSDSDSHPGLVSKWKDWSSDEEESDDEDESEPEDHWPVSFMVASRRLLARPSASCATPDAPAQSAVPPPATSGSQAAPFDVATNSDSAGQLTQAAVPGPATPADSTAASTPTASQTNGAAAASPAGSTAAPILQAAVPGPATPADSTAAPITLAAGDVLTVSAMPLHQPVASTALGGSTSGVSARKGKRKRKRGKRKRGRRKKTSSRKLRRSEKDYTSKFLPADANLIRGMVVGDVIIPDQAFLQQTHALGNQENGELGLMHCVIGNDSDVTYQEHREHLEKKRNRRPCNAPPFTKHGDFIASLPPTGLGAGTETVRLEVYSCKHSQIFPARAQSSSREHLLSCKIAPSPGPDSDGMVLVMEPKSPNGECHLLQFALKNECIDRLAQASENVEDSIEFPCKPEALLPAAAILSHSELKSFCGFGPQPGFQGNGNSRAHKEDEKEEQKRRIQKEEWLQWKRKWNDALVGFKLGTGDHLLRLMKGRAGKKGTEVTRTGGALGLFDSNSAAFKRFISRRGTLPRRRRACAMIGLNTPSKSGFLCLYRGKGGKIVTFWYNTPQHGGNQLLTTAQLESSQHLRSFPWIRVATAYSLLQINKLLGSKKLPPIAETATKKLLKDYFKAVHCALANLQKPKMSMDCSPFVMLARLSKHTLVQHVVGGHVDVFSENGTDNIENKVLLVSENRSCLSGKKSVGGRGGPPGVYVFALLDWDAPSKHRKKVFHDNNPGNNVQRVTQRRMEEFLDNIVLEDRLIVEAEGLVLFGPTYDLVRGAVL